MYLYSIPQFSKLRAMDNKHDSLLLVRKYARIFVLGHYLFLEAHSFARATLLGTDNVRGQIF